MMMHRLDCGDRGVLADINIELAESDTDTIVSDGTTSPVPDEHVLAAMAVIPDVGAGFMGNVQQQQQQ